MVLSKWLGDILYPLVEETVYVSLEENIHRILRARLNVKARLVCKGRHD